MNLLMKKYINLLLIVSSLFTNCKEQTKSEKKTVYNKDFSL